METRVFCVELKMGPSGHMDSTGIFPGSNTRECGPRRTTQRQPPRPTHKCSAPRLPFHVHITHDLTRAASALPLHTAALAFVSFGIVLVQVQVPRFLCDRFLLPHQETAPVREHRGQAEFCVFRRFTSTGFGVLLRPDFRNGDSARG